MLNEQSVTTSDSSNDMAVVSEPTSDNDDDFSLSHIPRNQSQIPE